MNTPTLNQITNLLDVLSRNQSKIKVADLSTEDGYDQLYETLKTRTLKQISFANALILHNKWIKLNEVLEEWITRYNNSLKK